MQQRCQRHKLYIRRNKKTSSPSTPIEVRANTKYESTSESPAPFPAKIQRMSGVRSLIRVGHHITNYGPDIYQDTISTTPPIDRRELVYMNARRLDRNNQRVTILALFKYKSRQM